MSILDLSLYSLAASSFPPLLNQQPPTKILDKSSAEFEKFQEGIPATFWQSYYYKWAISLRSAIRFLSGKITVLAKRILIRKSSAGFDETAFKEWKPSKIFLGIESEKKMTPYDLARNLGFAKDPKGIARELDNVPTRVFDGWLYKGEEEGFSVESRQVFRDELGLQQHNAEAIITPFTKALSLDAGVSEGYCVGTHSMMVVRMFDQHLEHKFAKVKNIISLGEFRLFLMLHDIGKGLAVKEEGQFETKERKRKELLYCQNAIDQLIQKKIFDPSKGRIFKGLLHDVTIGKFLTHQINMEQAKIELDQAMETHHLENVISKKDFFCLHKIFHTSDAGAYKSIRRLESLFEVNSKTRKVRYTRAKSLEEPCAGDKLRTLKAQLIS